MDGELLTEKEVAKLVAVMKSYEQKSKKTVDKMEVYNKSTILLRG